VEKGVEEWVVVIVERLKRERCEKKVGEENKEKLQLQESERTSTVVE